MTDPGFWYSFGSEITPSYNELSTLIFLDCICSDISEEVPQAALLTDKINSLKRLM